MYIMASLCHVATCVKMFEVYLTSSIIALFEMKSEKAIDQTIFFRACENLSGKETWGGVGGETR